MDYYNRSCKGDRADIVVELGGGVRMTLHCESTERYGYHWRDWDDAQGHRHSGSPHFSELRLNETRIEFDWFEEANG